MVGVQSGRNLNLVGPRPGSLGVPPEEFVKFAIELQKPTKQFVNFAMIAKLEPFARYLYPFALRERPRTIQSSFQQFSVDILKLALEIP
jgi:hypothetical protein